MPSSYNPPGGGGGTFPATTALIKGTGVANVGADSMIAPADVVYGNIGALTIGNLISWEGAGVATTTIVATTAAQGLANGNAVGAATGIILSDGSNNISGVTALPDGTTATTQSQSDNSTKVATTAYVDGYGFLTTGGDISDTQGTNADIRAAIAAAISADTGWTANADAGDKTAVIGSTATLDAIATALNLVTAGAGTQLENIAQKVKALESALAIALRPNA